jgi:hypothetical protein
MSTVNESGNPYDLSGQGRMLTNGNAATFGIYSLQPYTTFNGINQFHYRLNEAGLAITGAITFVSWVRFASLGGVDKMIASKAVVAGNQFSWYLYKDTNDKMQFVISGDGIPANVVRAISVTTLSENSWIFVAGVYVPNTSISIFVNTDKVSNLVGVPASIFNSNSALLLGSFNTGLGALLDGNEALCALCATSCSDAQINALYWLTRPLFYGS